MDPHAVAGAPSPRPGSDAAVGTEPASAPPKALKLSVVMPIYNEEKTLEQIVAAVQKTPYEKELVLVDDCSTDRTPEIIAELGRKWGNIRAFRHETNKGKGGALATGFANVTGDVVLIQDADLEYDPGDYPVLLRPILDGRADVVFGSRFLGGPYVRVHLFHHYVGNRMLTIFSNVCTNLNLTDMETCYKVFKREFADRLDIQSRTFAVEPEITAKVAKMRARVYEVPISYAGRSYAEGKKIGFKDAMIACWAIVRWGLFA